MRPPLPSTDPLPSPERLRGMDIAYGRDRNAKIDPIRYQGEVVGQDAIGRAIERLKGRVFPIHRPSDFATAIRKMKAGKK